MAPMYKKDQIIYLDTERLEMEVSKRMRKANTEIAMLLKDTLIKNIMALPMKDNAVRMADGRITSDLERREALVASIKAERVGTFSKTWNKLVMGTYVDAMKTNFKDSHIGWYYEMGTGEKADKGVYASYNYSLPLAGDENPYRKPGIGTPIVSRSNKDGNWIDFGGNVRSTNSNIGGIGSSEPPKVSEGPRAGEYAINPTEYAYVLEKFKKNIGDDIKAYEWYRKAVEEVSEEILSIYTNAIRGLNILDPKYGIVKVQAKYVVG